MEEYRQKDILVTGGAGFIGSNFIKFILNNTSYHITNVDKLTYAGNSSNMVNFDKHSRYRFFHCNIADNEQLKRVFDKKYFAIINFAAETHVDRSIENAAPFIETNIKGTFNLLNYVIHGKAEKYIQISTDEVYGSLSEDEPSFTEKSPLSPNNPYSASKASADLLVRSFYKTYQIPVMITRCSNNYGPHQHTEKFIPKIIQHALQEKKIPLYGDGMNIRDWLFVEDHCRAISMVLENGKPGEIYNIGGDCEKTNKEVILSILNILGKSKDLIEHVTDRKGHDRRYSINFQKIYKQIGWQPAVSFDDGIRKTIDWYKHNLGREK
ncbi:MAG TPA: dTDP-glucose 4,6-dehydratase [Bacillus sp. (in: firmicutes)]|uniref:dTDP-glucose 4,6-dehydratase n=1 Tax=Bacillus litorisediminis TaxID=2922713 RepID=UPI001FADB871|nr:dTDP-glucose 4,6-dehydratase [Bacillus litorisediminis]HWO75386.1 dTDP-glucose 4,6-dehydratase [Bacillus sp. (in: firmicutes)]